MIRMDLTKINQIQYKIKSNLNPNPITVYVGRIKFKSKSIYFLLGSNQIQIQIHILKIWI